MDWNFNKISLMASRSRRTLRGCVDWNSDECTATGWKDKSHPTWVRGLKQKIGVLPSRGSRSRTLRGCVDWNLLKEIIIIIWGVAPYVGAWIETDTTTSGMTAIIRSHPTWVRGLKRKVVGICIAEGVIAPYVGAWIETDVITYSVRNNESHPTWVRGLKLVVCHLVAQTLESHPTWVRGLKRLIFLESKTFYTLTI